MEEEKDPSQIYIKGFNAGYQLKQHEPELLKDLLKSKNENSDFLKGLSDGERQYKREAMLKEQQAIAERNKAKKKSK